MSYNGNTVRIDIDNNGRADIVYYDVKEMQSILASSRPKSENAWQILASRMYKANVADFIKFGDSLNRVNKTISDWSLEFLQADSSVDFSGSTPMKIISIKQKKGAQACCDFEQLSNLFDIDKEACDFIRNNSFLLPLLETLHSKIFDYFTDAKLGLEVVKDPEIKDESQLFLSIATSTNPEYAIEKLYEFDQQWWLANVHQAQGKLCLDVVFI
ncbi:hypothetical protein [Sporomusa sphaeroides]|uniref:Uncharacterized protein n=1 Tax=Sporomusa sphaeroides DSM 2875 TaxID=1337886 RepID=A0ABM9VYH8_9FIRM|nr:hypothetical protein [Sporomusa sphaeroides]OLS58284.1 hypothetical protein SPSPH_18200 [Sporomusa sphaeroides DSM 2875]CVK17529.1 hypothetical protein SSPH_00163 [Sporomusa sphaeroides DSM 2875]